MFNGAACVTNYALSLSSLSANVDERRARHEQLGGDGGRGSSKKKSCVQVRMLGDAAHINKGKHHVAESKGR
jgi:hypothetical protein